MGKVILGPWTEPPPPLTERQRKLYEMLLAGAAIAAHSVDDLARIMRDNGFIVNRGGDSSIALRQVPVYCSIYISKGHVSLIAFDDRPTHEPDAMVYGVGDGHVVI